MTAMRQRAPTSAPPTEEMKVRFGENLARCREGIDVSQEELSFRASIHRTEVSLLERGERMPRVDTALRIAGSLGVPLDDHLASAAFDLKSCKMQPMHRRKTKHGFSFARHCSQKVAGQTSIFCAKLSKCPAVPTHS